jgi:hypothetical protein
MSLVKAEELSRIPSPTFIYLASKTPVQTIPGSFVYRAPTSFKDLVSDFSRFEAPSFPIICYDDGDMRLASHAFWVFSALHMPVLVLYGGLKACEEENLPLSVSFTFTLPQSLKPSPVDSELLLKSASSGLNIENLPFSLYDVLGVDLSVEKLKKLLRTHGIRFDVEGENIIGKCAAEFGVMVVYMGISDVKVFIDEWEESKARPKLSIAPESYRTGVGTVYYDAEEGRISDLENEEEAVECVEVNESYENTLTAMKIADKNKQKNGTAGSVCSGCCLL